MEINKDFDGVFKFSNPTDEDFKTLWNNKEYNFPAQTTSPMIIQNETLENIQAIRKKFAYKLAVREFYKSKEYVRMSKMGGGLPPTFDDKLLEPMIQQCLTPLSASRAIIKELPREKAQTRVSKAVSGKDNLNETFKDDIEETGLVMPDGNM